MSQITIQCRLVASPETRQQLWMLMAERNTPLVNTLIQQIGQHEDFEAWRRKGKIPSSAVAQLCQSLKTDPRFNGQPARFYASAIHIADYIFKSWLALQKRLQQQLDRKVRWLESLRSDQELIQESGCELNTLRDRAAAILSQLQTSTDSAVPKTNRKNKLNRKKKNSDSSDTEPNLYNLLRQQLSKANDAVERCAIVYLLKNCCTLPDDNEDPQKFAQRRRKAEIQVQRLQDQIEGRMPKGRDLIGQSWLRTLAIATTTVPQDNSEAKRWQDKLLTKPSSLPFPVSFETNEDMVWSKNERGRLGVHFNGMSEHRFKIYCDQRQLHWFQRFLEDQETKRSSKTHSSSLFTLRSGRLAWQEGEGKGEPWDIHHLTLYCTVDKRLWTDEGTEQVRQERAAELAEKITGMKEKGNLSKTQTGYVQRMKSTLTRINHPFDRPSAPLYQASPNILLGVSLGLEYPATVTVLDISTNQVLATRTVRELLGKNYGLLLRQRRQQQRTAHQRHKAQKRSAPNQQGESELGQYVDRLLAKEIIAIAKAYRASSIAVPKLSEIQEILQCEVQAKAEQKCPGYVEVQKRYAKQYRVNVHRWSYGRLMSNIQSQAAKLGISVEEGKQPFQGTQEEKAKELAIGVYQSRKVD